MSDARKLNQESLLALMSELREWAAALGFSQIGVADVNLSSAEPGLLAWLGNGFHGSMGYMAAHGVKRARPAELVPGTVRVITARMDYLPQKVPHNSARHDSAPDNSAPDDWQAVEWQHIHRPDDAGVDVCARRDYHKVLRARLQKLADRLAQAWGHSGTVCSRSRRQCSNGSWLRAAASVGAASTRWRCTEKPARCFSWARSTSTGAAHAEPVSRTAAAAACIDTAPRKPSSALPGGMRGAHLVPDHEHDGPIPEALRANPWATASTVGDDCQLVCPGTSTRSAARCRFRPRAPLHTPSLLQLWA